MSNVVNIFDKKKKENTEQTKEEKELNFEEIAAYNQKKKEKLERERKSANKSVLRSYRIKN